MQSNIFLVYGTAKPRDEGNGGGGAFFLRVRSIGKSGFRF